MRGFRIAAGLLATLGVLAWVNPARADDTIRLNGVGDAPTRNLVDDGQGADTIRTWHHGYGGYRGFGYGGYRGFGYGGFGGYRSFGYGGLGYGGYRGFGYGSFYRPYFGGFGLGGLYRPYYGGFGLGGLGYGLGGFGYGMGYGMGYGFFPCSGVVAGSYTLAAPVATLGTPLPQGQGIVQPAPAGAVPAPAPDGTYQYDGGPRETAPLPNQVAPSPMRAPQRTTPMDGRAVSLPKTTPKWSYPAYGETAQRIIPSTDRTYLTRGQAK